MERKNKNHLEMIETLRKFIFLLFRKLIPLSRMEAAIREERVNVYRQYCMLGEHTVLHPDARIVNFQGKPENIRVGDHCMIRGELLVNAYGGKISIGNYSSVGEASRIWSSEEIQIGDSVHISHGVNIMDGNTHSLDPQERHGEYAEIMRSGHIKQKGNIGTAPVIIEDFAWISFNASVLRGVRVGKGAVVAAHSVVTKDVEPFTLVAGNPAVKIRDIIQKGKAE